MFSLHPTPHDLSFRLFGFPVRVQPFFWIVIALIGIPSTFPNLATMIHTVTAFVAAGFLSVLVHELGHALVFRHVYGVPASIVLHAVGGVTIPVIPHKRKRGFAGTACEVLLSFAGPFAGFLLAALFYFVIMPLVTPLLMRPFAGELPRLGVHFWIYIWMYFIVAVSVLWGIFNLLPVYPMDGGQISREIFCWLFRRRGVEISLILSILTAAICSVLAILKGQFFLPMFFGYFAFQNYFELTSKSFRRWN